MNIHHLFGLRLSVLALFVFAILPAQPGPCPKDDVAPHPRLLATAADFAALWDGDIGTSNNLGSAGMFTWSGQYLAQIRQEEEFHLRQLKGEVGIEEGGMVECYTQQGIRYFIQEQAKTKDYVSGETLLVQGDSPAEVRKRARKVIRKAEDDEFEKSLQIVKGNRYYIEYKAKQHVKYNAAFRWECTYGKDMPGKIPVYKHHPAYE